MILFGGGCRKLLTALGERISENCCFIHFVVVAVFDGGGIVRGAAASRGVVGKWEDIICEHLK